MVFPSRGRWREAPDEVVISRQEKLIPYLPLESTLEKKFFYLF